MNATPKFTDNQKASRPAYGHAVVIGGSIAGLVAARVLTDHFARITIIERDRLPDTPDFRRGAPQARHAHTLPLRGEKVLEDLFPGLVDELVAQGAISINADNELAIFLAGEWHDVKHHSINTPATCFSRPLLESTLYRRMAAHSQVNIIQEVETIGLCTDEQRRRVSGVRYRDRHDLKAPETELAADLVIDASGRNSSAPQWLADLGYLPPLESTINAFSGYATRIYRQPEAFADRWKTMYIKPAPSKGTRGGIVIPMEGDRWTVTLIGMAGDYPPTDEEAFLDFARSLPTSRLAEAIKDAEPLTRPYGYRRTETRVRHFDTMPRYLEGFLVYGDAAYVLNPVYAMGMTAVALGSQALTRCLEAQRHQDGAGDLTGLASAFQKQLSQAVNGPLKMVTREDQRWPTTNVTERVVPSLRRSPARRTTAVPRKRERVATGVFINQHRRVAAH